MTTKIVKLNLEGGGSDRLPKLRDNRVDERLLGMLDEKYHQSCFTSQVSGHFNYLYASEAASGVSVDANAMQRFIDVILPSYSDTEVYFQFQAGMFLSALINNCPDNNIVLDVARLPKLNYLCSCLDNQKEVTILGDVGNYAAFGAKSGKVTIHGSAENGLGSELDGATVMVDGDAGMNVGSNAHSGEIHLGGKRFQLAPNLSEDVRIFHRKNKIWPRPK
ncbi:MAG: hypothetical protein V1921_02570 [Candidatus Altiarchaeota archaeon]